MVAETFVAKEFGPDAELVSFRVDEVEFENADDGRVVAKVRVAAEVQTAPGINITFSIE
jgi:hypothetical protein